MREYARMALEKVKDGGAPALHEWAEYLLTTIQGWRGNRADQVRESLRRFLAP